MIFKSPSNPNHSIIHSVIPFSGGWRAGGGCLFFSSIKYCSKCNAQLDSNKTAPQGCLSQGHSLQDNKGKLVILVLLLCTKSAVPNSYNYLYWLKITGLNRCKWRAIIQWKISFKHSNIIKVAAQPDLQLPEVLCRAGSLENTYCYL